MGAIRGAIVAVVQIVERTATARPRPERLPRRADAFMVPQLVPGRPGQFLVDSRLSRYPEGGTLPGAVSIPHGETAARLDELDPELDTVLFCNGPQCAATPDAIATLLAADHPPERILHYRGGLHDWLSAGASSGGARGSGPRS